jgi:hypothetical protein
MTFLLSLLWLALMADCASPSGRFAVLRKQSYAEHYDTYPTSSSSTSTHSTNRQARRSSTRIYDDDNIDGDSDDYTIRDSTATIHQQSSDCKGRFAVEYSYERNLNRSAEHANILQRGPDIEHDTNNNNNNNGCTTMPAVSNTRTEGVQHNNRRQQPRAFIHQNNDPIFV